MNRIDYRIYHAHIFNIGVQTPPTGNGYSYACEHKQLTLKCGSGEYIKILSAMYGRKKHDWEMCPMGR